MKTLIVSGGHIDVEFALMFCKSESWDRIIGVDAGTEFLFRNHILPTDMVGDFDTLAEDILRFYKNRIDVKIRKYRPEKDVTDTQAAVELAVEYGSCEIYILGGTGTRMDHTLANIHVLKIALERGISCSLVDEYNEVTLLKESGIVKKSSTYGKYISFIPLTTEVKGLTLRGFKYPLTDCTMRCGDSLGISNEFLEDEASVEFEDGILIMIQSKD